MKIAVIGGGGREHAIIRQFKKSRYQPELFCLPGNAGIAEDATCVPVGAMEFDKIVAFAKDNAVDLVFVAPDDPLAGGLVDRLQDAGIRAFGPTAAAAIVEGSKAFSKDFMKRHGIPTAAYEVFDDFARAEAYLKTADYPLVLKADGLALGKGVVICASEQEGLQALRSMMLDNVFGKAGSRVVAEEFLTGHEVSLLVFTDGEHVVPMPSSQDHKRAYDNDQGPNTGGMGAFTPSRYYTDAIAAETAEKIVKPTIEGLKAEGRKFVGVLYFGLMLTEKGVKVLEYNARFGDPETQAVLPLLETDFVDVVNACIDGTLDRLDVRFADKVGFCVVIASGGYPVNVVKGYPVTIGDLEGVTLIHAGTAIRDGKLVTNGGRVFCLTTVADTMEEARKTVYREIDKVSFTDSRYRRDIGVK